MYDAIVKLSKALSEKNREKLFQIILQESALCNLKYDKPAYRGNCTKMLCEKTSLSQSTLSHHLKILEENGLIYRRKSGKWEHFFPNERLLAEVKKEISSIESQNKIELEFLEKFTTNKNFGLAEFEELVSLVENHDFNIVHKTKRNITHVAYLRFKANPEKLFILIFNPETKIITLQIQKHGEMKDDTITSLDFSEKKDATSRTLINVINRYLPVIGRKKLLI